MFFPNNVYRHASPLEHIQLFTEQSINTLLANNGLEINSIWWHGLDIHQLLIELEFLSDGFMESEAAKLLLSLFNQLQESVDRTRQSDRILLVASKSRHN